MSTITAGGQIIEAAHSAPNEPHAPQKIAGSAVDAATASLSAKISQQVAASKSLGAGQRGAGKRRKKYKGGGNVVPPAIPTASSIQGISPASVHAGAVNNLAQLRAGAVYDKHIGAQPMQVGGKKKKTRRKRNGRNNTRNHRRSRRSSRSNKRKRSIKV
jgi:hypothetical protein